MRMKHYAIAVALLAGWASTATAQTSPGGIARPPAATAGDEYGSHWVAAGFVGTTFGLDADDAAFDFGGQIGYLWGGVFGAEFLADYSPNFNISNILLADNPKVASYMVNAIAAAPWGNWQPYVSTGIGSIQMVTDVFLGNTTDPNFIDLGTNEVDKSRFGWNLGAGVMGFAKSVGFRADIRYYRARTDNTFVADNLGDEVTLGLLSGLQFWRGNVGVAFRW